MTDYRREEAKRVRDSASQQAYDRAHPTHQSNGDEQRYAIANYAMSFTKGLEHDSQNGLIQNANDFRAFRAAIDNGEVDAFTTSVPSASTKARMWEAPTAGLVYDLQGPDSQAVTLAPAPALGSSELAYEMAEVYELALVRDVPLAEFNDASSNPDLMASINRLNNISYDVTGLDGRPRKNVGGNVTGQTVFRGSSPGVDQGPYLSQFMLLGNKSVAGDGDVTNGIISYGALNVDQRVPAAMAGVNFITDWNDWLAVQNGTDPQSGNQAAIFGSPVTRRFISTPRDLATYVHYDALYEAYLNACLILLGMGAPTDPSFDKLSGGGCLHLNSVGIDNLENSRRFEMHEREAGGFALWGGPHILTLVTEVATRALKAVRYQKFNIHCRLRPEALAGRIHSAGQIESDFPAIGNAFTDLEASIQDTVNAIRGFNATGTALLPMAFQEGSPMHPAYGAGHATVAGACVTILKAYFDTSAVLVQRQYKDSNGNVIMDGTEPRKDILFTTNPLDNDPVKVECDGTFDPNIERGTDTSVAFVPHATMDTLTDVTDGTFLTLEGELNKLAANISIGRDMAGVHYFSDYYDSLRMGEAIALGILKEQALCYAQDPFVFSVPTFDGDICRIGAR